MSALPEITAPVTFCNVTYHLAVGHLPAVHCNPDKTLHKLLGACGHLLLQFQLHVWKAETRNMAGLDMSMLQVSLACICTSLL